LLRVFLALLLLLVLTWSFLQTGWGQNWLAHQVTKRLSKDLQTHINIKNVSFSFFDKMDLEGVLVEDQKNDTLISAGKIQVRITDWFFFKDKAELKYIGLEDAAIYLNRKDSVWNYHFLEKYFSSTDTSTKKKAGIQFDLKKVVMKNVVFIKRDAWIGNDMVASFKSLDMDANEISLTGQTVDIANLDLDSPYFSLLDYTGNRVKQVSSAKKITDSTAKQNTPGWDIKFTNVKITNGRFRNDRDSLVATTPYFDGQHIDFNKINGTLKNIGWANDTIKGNISLSTRERSGFVVKSLKAATTIHPKAMIFDNLYLETNRSVIGNHFSMSYPGLRSLNNFIHAVTMEANFNKATVSSDDIAFFAPAMRTWKKNIKLDGRVKGTVDALASKDLEIWAGNKTYLHGAVSIVGLPNIKETLINVEAQDLQTTYGDVLSFIPSIRNINTPDLRKLTYLRFKGTYTGFINDFVTYGTIQTNLGTLRTDLNMKFPVNADPLYSGTISTEGFQLGSFINSSRLGLVDFHGTVKGKGFKWNTLDMNIDGIVHKIQYENYTYQNITAKGTLSDRLFTGDFVIKDPNADLHLNGLVDLRGTKPLFNVKADVAHANLKPLQLTKEDMRLSGLFDLNLQGSSLSDILGSARISKATLIHNGKELSFDSLVVTSGYVNGLRTLKAVSNEFNATVTGDFDLDALPDAFTLFLNRYYPAYIRAPRTVKPQTFTFDVTTGVVEDYIKLIDSRLSGFNNSHITGSLNTTANTMTVDADVPRFSFKQYDFSDVQLKGSGDLEKLTLTGQVMNAQIGDSLLFPQTTFSLQAQNDISDIVINTTANQAINQANLSAQIKTFSDGVTVLFNPSSFVLNGKTWTLEQGGELNFRKNSIVQGQAIFREANQQIRLWTQPSPEGNWNDLHVALQNVNIGDFSPFLTKKNRIEGNLFGEAVIEDPQNKFNVTSNLHVTELRLDNDSLGQFDASLNYNNKTGLLTGNGNNVDPEHHLNFNLALNLKDTNNVFRDKISLQPVNYRLNILEHFLGNLFSDIDGYVTGNIDILGEGADRDYIAKAKVKDARFKVNFTQVAYKIDDTEIELKKDLIDLDNIRIRDRFGNSALVKGYIRHKGFQDMYYDLAVQTESPQMELINTTYKNNQQFYGRAMGSGSFVLVGPQSDMLMNIDAQASSTDSSFLTLPPSRSRESGQASFMVERKYGREMTREELRSNTTNLTYDINLTANPMATVEVILDELTGDVIRGRGTGNLRINSGTSAPLSIRGRYDINEGNYLFTFQSLFKKPFVLKKGANNYIEWNGDPYDANVHLEAVYTAEKVSFAPLAGTLITTKAIDLNHIRDDVDVVATLTGNLFHPTFNFKLEFPSNNRLYNDPAFSFGIQQIEKNQNELNKQVTYLIVFNSFTPYENAQTGGARPFEEAVSSTISGLLFGEVNRRLNQLLSKILRNNNLTFNFTGSLYNRNLIDPNAKGLLRINQSDLNISVGKSLFNDRLSFTVGGTFDVPLQSQSDVQQTFHLFPDVSVELLLNKSGSVKATFFYRENVDFLTGASTSTNITAKRYGSSISYGKEFNSFGELFGRKKKQKQRTDSLPVNKPDSTIVGSN
jgi:hypothetical protein